MRFYKIFQRKTLVHRLPLLFGSGLALTILACGETGLGSLGPVELPSVQVNCGPDACSNVTGVSSALVYFSESDCEQEFEIVASSTSSLSCDSLGCVGQTSGGWFDSSGQPVDEVDASDGLFLCVHIDSDQSGAGEFNAGDILYSRLVFLNGQEAFSTNSTNWLVL